MLACEDKFESQFCFLPLFPIPYPLYAFMGVWVCASEYTSLKFFILYRNLKKKRMGERVKLSREEDLWPRVCTPMNFKVDFFFFTKCSFCRSIVMPSGDGLPAFITKVVYCHQFDWACEPPSSEQHSSTVHCDSADRRLRHYAAAGVERNNGNCWQKRKKTCTYTEMKLSVVFPRGSSEREYRFPGSCIILLTNKQRIRD